MSSKKIRNTALRLFTEHGYEGTSLADISEIVGIKKSSIYNHYKSKDDLYISIFESSSQSSLALIRELFTDTYKMDYATLIRQILDKVVSLFPTHFETRFLFRFICYPPEHLQPQVEAVVQNYLSGISNQLLNAIMENLQTTSKQQAELFAMHFRILIYGLYTQYLCKGETPTSEILDYFATALTANVKSGGILSRV